MFFSSRRSPSLPVLLVAIFLVGISGCTNDPYPGDHKGKNYYYSSFDEPPKHLDPARSYSSDEYIYIQQIYEPPFEYHFLKRPFQLVPLTAESLPEPEYYDAQGKRLSRNAPSEQVARAIYTIRIRSGIRYQDHPCFARGEDGKHLYHDLSWEDVGEVERVEDFPEIGTRELTAHDYVYQIRRLAHPQLACPILSLMTVYIEGLTELNQALEKELTAIREKRRLEAGPLYNQELDERENPIRLDLERFEFPGAQVIDDHTYQIVLKKKYPQMLYWLAMPFFSPVPPEADRFYTQGPMVEKDIKLDNSPVGTGAYRIETYQPNKEIVLVRNENFRSIPYPSEGEPGDKEAGHLRDAGKKTPFIDKAIYKLEKEAIPRWGKFLQGYYDTSGIASDVFDQAVSSGDSGLGLSDDMRKQGIQLVKDVKPTVYYYAFNMLDDVVGGLTPEKKKLRQAISIAIDMEEYIQIFRNDRDVPSFSPIPPGIFGYQKGRDGINPFVYDWDEQQGRPVRKSIEEAQRLLAEAGYPRGRGPDGRPLVLAFDTTATSASDNPTLDWFRKQFRKLGIDLQIRGTDYNRFRDKVKKGNFQILSWGWNADYPDPENFLFLLYGPNSRARFQGENTANYDNPEFNRLFQQIETMENGPERLALIQKMIGIVQEDAPWVPRFFLVDFVLQHRWYGNSKPMAIGGGILKYRRIDANQRQEERAAWNEPILWPLALLAVVLVLSGIPAWRTIRARERRCAVS